MRTWSVSSIRGFHACQLQWWFRRQGAPEEFRALPLVEGNVLHAALAFDLKGRQAGLPPSEAETIEVLEASWFSELCGSGASVQYGRTMDEGRVLERMRNLYRLWRADFRVEGEIVAVEEEIRVELPGLDLPLLGYVDLAVHTEHGDQVIDFKTSSSRPSVDELLDPLDLQKLAMTRGWETAKSRAVGGWNWTYLVKTKEPQVIPVDMPVEDSDRERDLRRLASIVNPTIKTMEAVLAGNLLPVPTQSYFAPCSGCPYRRRCADVMSEGLGASQEGDPSSRSTVSGRPAASNASPDDSGVVPGACAPETGSETVVG